MFRKNIKQLKMFSRLILFSTFDVFSAQLLLELDTFCLAYRVTIQKSQRAKSINGKTHFILDVIYQKLRIAELPPNVTKPAAANHENIHSRPAAFGIETFY